MQGTDASVERGQGGHLAGRHREDAADEKLLDVLAPLGGPVDDEHGYRRRHGIHDTDDRLLGDRAAMNAARREESSPSHREGEGIPVRRLALNGMTGQHRHREAQSGDLGQREIDEDDTSGKHVQTQVGVNAREDQARQQGDAKQLDHSSALTPTRRGRS